MTWVKLADDWYENRKFWGVSDAAELLYVRCLTWAARNLTDGFVPDQTVAQLVPEGLRRSRRTPRGELLAHRLWHRANGGIAIHDYADYQPTREQVLAARTAKSAVRQEAGRKGARARWQRR
jgi:hypothetical protein